MAASALDVEEIARRLVASEAGDSPDGAAVAAAVQNACAGLSGDLRRTLGAHGVSALLGRALSLAKRDHPILAGVTLDGASDSFHALDEALADRPGASAAAAGASILAHLWALLVLLLGETLGMQPVYKLWPYLAPGSKGIVE